MKKNIKVTITKNEKGDILSRIEYNTRGLITKSVYGDNVTENIYDESGLKLLETHIDGKLYCKREFENDNLIKEVYSTCVRENEYDDNNNIVASRCTYNENNIYHTEKYEYDDKGNKIKYDSQSIKDENITSVYAMEYEYDDNNNMIYCKSISQGKIVSESRYEYDDKGNMISYSDDEEKEIYEYNNDNKLLRAMQVEPQVKVICMNEFDDKGRILFTYNYHDNYCINSSYIDNKIESIIMEDSDLIEEIMTLNDNDDVIECSANNITRTFEYEYYQD